jgi:hypothetical protein
MYRADRAALKEMVKSVLVIFTIFILLGERYGVSMGQPRAVVALYRQRQLVPDDPSAIDSVPLEPSQSPEGGA